MVTGDHVRTAISVAHQCHILPMGRPVLLVDAPAPAAAGQPPGRASLSVLYPDGSANSRITLSSVLSQVGGPIVALAWILSNLVELVLDIARVYLPMFQLLCFGGRQLHDVQLITCALPCVLSYVLMGVCVPVCHTSHHRS